MAETGLRIEGFGLEAGPLSQWLFEGIARVRLLRNFGLEVGIVGAAEVALMQADMADIAVGQPADLALTKRHRPLARVGEKGGARPA